MYTRVFIHSIRFLIAFFDSRFYTQLAVRQQESIAWRHLTLFMSSAVGNSAVSSSADSSCSDFGSNSDSESGFVSERAARKREKKVRKQEKKARKKEKKARKRDRKALKHAKKRKSPEISDSAPPTHQQGEMSRKKARAGEGECARSSSTLDFFAQLHRAEAQKPALGTIHATARTTSEVDTKASSDWECQKCGESNFSNSADCRKCHALKRLTTYR